MIDYLDHTFNIISGLSYRLDFEVVNPGPHSEREIKNLEAFQQLSKWLVVMRVPVIYCDFETAAKTGLFGLRGDARVQIINESDEAAVEAYMSFAERCERESAVLVPQDFGREPIGSMRKKLRKVVWREFGSEQLLETMHPAIMFRLCTRMRNHVAMNRGADSSS